MKAKLAALGLLGAAVVAAAATALEWNSSAVLRRELEWLREEHRALGRLRAENAQLKAEQPTTQEVERLRADRAAMLRARAEIEAMTARVEARR